VGDADFVISHMVTAKGDETYIMLFNKSWEDPVIAAFAVSPYSGIQSLTYVSPWGGNEYPVSLADGAFTETFRPGEGKLFKLNGNLTRKVLPIQRNPARLILETPEPAELVGLDVTFSSDTDMKASTLQITTNKRFPEEKTLILAFDHDPADTNGTDKGTAMFPKNGKVRFDPYMGKHIRFTVHDEASWYNYGYAELRVRFAGEPELASDPVEGVGETVLYTDVDFTALDEAIAAFGRLKETNYTAESWRAAANYYRAALDMKDGHYPQNAVTVAAWKLMDSIRELQPVTDNRAPAENKTLHVDKGIVAAAVATLAGAVTGAVVGIIASIKKKK